MTLRSFKTDEIDSICEAVRRTLVNNSTSIDAVFVVTQGNKVLLGELPDGPVGAMTLFQTDLGIVRWNGCIDFLSRSRGTFLANFDVVKGFPNFYPLRVEAHKSFNGRNKMLAYFAVGLGKDDKITPKSDIRFGNIGWQTATKNKGWPEHLANLRTEAKRNLHVKAIMAALALNANPMSLLAA